MTKDLSDIEVGMSLPTLTFGPITRQTLALYAGASADHNPIHIDTDFAKQAGMDDVFAHGMLSMAQLGRLVTDWVGSEHLASLQTRFLALTFVGDTVTCKGEVKEKFEQDGSTFLRLALSAAKQTGDKTLSGEAVICLDPAK